MDLDNKNAGVPQATVDDFKEMDKRLYQVLIACTKVEAKIRIRRVDADGQSLRPKDSCIHFCSLLASNTSTEPEWTDIRKTQDAAECQEHHADV